MIELSLSDADGPFDVTVHEAVSPSRVALFAVGGGGDPRRHLPLLTALVERGCTVVAPHFARLGAPMPTDGDLLLRARRLRCALDAVMRPEAIAIGVGHSIGAAMLIALAGGKVWMRAGYPLPIAKDARLERLALLAPATAFFGAPGALEDLHAPIVAWTGTNDGITPPEHAQLLARQLEGRVPVEVRVIEGAGHFSFMNTPPPQTNEPLPDRDVFLAQLARDICTFVMR